MICNTTAQHANTAAQHINTTTQPAVARSATVGHAGLASLRDGVLTGGAVQQPRSEAAESAKLGWHHCTGWYGSAVLQQTDCKYLPVP